MKSHNLAASGEKTDMEDLDVLRGEVGRVLDLTRAYIERTGETEWDPALGGYQKFLTVLKANLRSALLKQFESLEIVLDLVDRNKGAVAGPLLRPACEEFIWIKYLRTIPLGSSENIIRLAGLEEICDSLTAIDETAGKAATEELGLTPYLRICGELKDERQGTLREIAKELDWPVKRKRILPSIRWLAKRVGEEYVYGIVYHATSRLVHFSPSELSRRVWWSKPDKKLLISSAHFSDHWNRFCLHWGALLFIYTMREILGFPIISKDDRATGRDGIDLPSVENIEKRIEDRGMPPIISSRELDWPAD